MCIKIYIFCFKKQTNKQKKKNTKNTKKQKKLKKKNYKVAIHEKKHLITKGIGFVAEQTNFRVKHWLVTYSMLV